MICKSCGFNAPNEANYCRMCGAPLRKTKIPPVLSAVLYAISAFVVLEAWQFVLTVILIAKSIASNSESFLSGVISDSFSDYIEAYTDTYSTGMNYVLLLAAVLTVATYVIFFAARHENPIESLAIRQAPAVMYPVAAVAGISLQIVVAIVLCLIYDTLPSEMTETVEMNTSIVASCPVWLSLVTVGLAVPVAEELCFRSIMHGKLSGIFPIGLAVATSSAIFGAAHGSLIGFIYAGLLGVILALLYEKSHSVIPCIICHAMFNTVSVLSDYIVPSTVKNAVIMLAAASVVLILTVVYIVIYKGNSPKGIENEAL